MNTVNFCTISTADHMAYVRALYDSLAHFNPEIIVHVFIADAQPESLDCTEFPEAIRLYGIDDLCKDDTGKKIFEKYQAVCMDIFRWSMKPVFLKYLLEHAGCKKIIFVDNDIYFFNEYAFLFDELNTSDVLLTPHWRASSPHDDPGNFFTLYTSGLYNGGFVGVNTNALRALEWWAMACLYVCEKNAVRGQFVDQTHLNLLPIYFENVQIIKHRGCNVANWNQIECARVEKNGSVLIQGTDPVVFIHFTHSTIRGIVKGDDALLAPFLDRYCENLKQYGVDLPSAAVSAPADMNPGIFKRIRTFFNG